jgi:hypothetical protein
MKRHQYRHLVFFLGVLAAPLLVSCTDFFSTSLASWAARDPASALPREINTGNVDDLITIAENNPGMSLEILKKINDAVQNAGEDEASSLRAAALQAAANASSLGPTLLNKADDIAGSINNAEDAQNLVIDAINDMSNLAETRDALNSLIPPPGPAFDSFVEKADANDLATAAAVLLAAEAKDVMDDGDYIKNFDPSDPTLSPGAALAVQLATEAAKKYEAEAAASANGNGTGASSGGFLKDILDGLNLVAPPVPSIPPVPPIP